MVQLCLHHNMFVMYMRVGMYSCTSEQQRTCLSWFDLFVKSSDRARARNYFTSIMLSSRRSAGDS